VGGCRQGILAETRSDTSSRDKGIQSDWRFYRIIRSTRDPEKGLFRSARDLSRAAMPSKHGRTKHLINQELCRAKCRDIFQANKESHSGATNDTMLAMTSASIKSCRSLPIRFCRSPSGIDLVPREGRDGFPRQETRPRALVYSLVGKEAIRLVL
jgi:hypothetical protein